MKRHIKKNISLVLASIIALCAFLSPASEVQATATDVVVLSTYNSWDFTSRSEPELICLTESADSVSLHATCEGDTADHLYCYIEDIERNGYDGINSQILDIYADGTVTTFFFTFPVGEYKVYFLGDGTITKTNAVIAFAKIA